MKINSIRFKASVFFSGILFLILVIYSSVLFFTVKRILYRDIDKDLQIKVDQITGILNAYAEVTRFESHPLSLMRRLLAEKGFTPDNRSIIDELWKTDVESLNLKNDYFQVWNRDGKLILVSGALPGDLQKLLDEQIPLTFDHVIIKSVNKKGQPLRVISYPFLYNKQVPLRIRLSTPLDHTKKILQELMLFMAITSVATLVLTSSLGILIARSILKPVVSVIDTARMISHKDLSVRIPGQEMDHEMMALIDAFNTMLGRLETAFFHINEFSSHVAHELKTPLAIMKGELEQALLEDRDEAEYKDVMRSSLQEIDRMVRIIKDLLLLASLEYKMDIFNFQKGNIVDFLNEVYEHGVILASEKQLSIDLNVADRVVLVEFDPVHLRRLFLNLIHNAVKFTPTGGHIEIKLSLKDREVWVSVSDSGEGIPPGDLSRIFEKFYRVSKSSQPGHGLGLTIAQSIARAHHGDIRVSSQLNKGTTFTLVLPRAA